MVLVDQVYDFGLVPIPEASIVKREEELEAVCSGDLKRLFNLNVGLLILGNVSTGDRRSAGENGGAGRLLYELQVSYNAKASIPAC